MAYSDRSTSPDPLTRPSSPLATRTRSTAAARRSNKPLALRSNNVVSPSKSFVMDTGKSGDVSPWRIKVTVEAEPKEGSSPTKRATRTITVPLKGGSSSSPVKRSSPIKKKAIADDETDIEIKRPQRKRKGTPMRRPARRSQPSDSIRVEETESNTVPSGRIEMSQKLQEELSSPDKYFTRSSAGLSRAHDPQNDRGRSSAKKDGMHRVLGQEVSVNSMAEREDSSPIRDIGDGDMTVANEDFTMVSMEELESLKHNTSILDNSGIDKSAASVSYMPSSPPQAAIEHPPPATKVVAYPSIAAQAREAKRSPAANLVNSYSTADKQEPSSVAAKPEQGKPLRGNLRNDPTEWRRERQAISQEIENANASKVVVIDDDTEMGAEGDGDGCDSDGPGPNAGGEELDIWAEEASRSIEEEIMDPLPPPATKQPESRPPQLEDLFSDQPLKPPRSKIPRTWRRTSGADFSYVDSPEHGALTSRQPSGASTDGDGAGSRSSAGVLTPPESSDDDAVKPGEDEAYEEGDTSLTQPDAAATQLQDHHHESVSSSHAAPYTRRTVISPVSESSSDGTTPDGGDTGLFWQSNLPNVYKRPVRPRLAQKQKAMDLSELLNLGKSEASPQSEKLADQASKQHMSSFSRTSSAKASLYQPKPAHARPTVGKVISSPLRKSLLKSSKIGGSTLPSTASVTSSSVVRERTSYIDRSTADDGTLTASFESKASDQRQLLAEMGLASSQARSSRLLEHSEADFSGLETVDESAYSRDSETASCSIHDEDAEKLLEDDQHSLEEHTAIRHDVGHSYEERLNVESPRKIRVNFNDSEGQSSALAPKKEYPPLFGSDAVAQQPHEVSSPPSVTLVTKRHAAHLSELQPGILSRLSTNFWSAIVRPSGPILVDPPPPDPDYSPSLRAHIRSRYGVLSDQYPWTMSHMRTLHRLLNSCTSGKIDSVVPKSGPLPACLENLIGQTLRDVITRPFTFTEQHAHVVDAFMQVLVPAHYIDAMRNGEVEFIGDGSAKSHRGLLAGRHGDDAVFVDFLWMWLPKGTIKWDFVAKAVGNCVFANIGTAEREAAEAERVRRIREERRAWERKNGFVEYDDEEYDETTEEYQV